MPCYRPINGCYPCGKCVGCMKSRANAYSMLLYRNSMKYGGFYFLTLTYNDDTLPIRYRVIPKSNPFDTYKEPTMLLQAPLLRQQYLDATRSRSGKSTYVFKRVNLSYEGTTYEACASLDRRNVRLWLKSCRIDWYRHHNYPLTFQFFCCGEYGSHSNRPHYHLALFNASQSEVDYMCSRWNEQYGYSLAKHVLQFGERGGTKDSEAATMYISKYISKGSLDFYELEAYPLLIEKPRIQRSKKMTDVFSEQEKAYIMNSAETDPFQSEFTFDELAKISSHRLQSVNGKQRFLGSQLLSPLVKMSNDDPEQKYVANEFDIDPVARVVRVRNDVYEHLDYYNNCIYNSLHTANSTSFQTRDKNTPLQAALSAFLRFVVYLSDREFVPLTSAYDFSRCRPPYPIVALPPVDEDSNRLREEAATSIRRRDLSKDIF